MEPVLALREEPSIRLLVFYADLESAVAHTRLLRRDERELIFCPASIHIDNWLIAMQPDLVLLHFPEEARDILAICERVRGHTDRPIVALAPAGDEMLVAHVLGLGIDEYVPLPMGDAEYLARLEALLRRLRQERAAGERMTVGGLTLSPSDHTVQRNGQRIGLSPIEYRLLSCLVSAPGTVMTHQTLMARVWGAEYVDSRHYLRIYIRYLREKLEDDPNKPALILSEWGIGYRFQPQTTVAVATATSR